MNPPNDLHTNSVFVYTCAMRLFLTINPIVTLCVDYAETVDIWIIFTVCMINYAIAHREINECFKGSFVFTRQYA